MKLSTRSRYGTRLMFDLAINQSNNYVLLKDIARRQGLSVKYLSKLIIPLKNAGFVNSARGFKGGYAIAKDPSNITVRDIVEVLEGEITPVECVDDISACCRSKIEHGLWPTMYVLPTQCTQPVCTTQYMTTLCQVDRSSARLEHARIFVRFFAFTRTKISFFREKR